MLYQYLNTFNCFLRMLCEALCNLASFPILRPLGGTPCITLWISNPSRTVPHAKCPLCSCPACSCPSFTLQTNFPLCHLVFPFAVNSTYIFNYMYIPTYLSCIHYMIHIHLIAMRARTMLFYSPVSCSNYHNMRNILYAITYL